MRALLLLLLAAPALAAAPPWVKCFTVNGNVTTVCNLCQGYTVSKRGDVVMVKCPGYTDHLFAQDPCRNPTMQRSATSVTIKCQP